MLFRAFRGLDVATRHARIAGVRGGKGPAVLLLHGYPETHLAWRHVAPALADRFTLLVPDLPGYGTSRVTQDGARWTKRRAALALVEMMDSLGHERFAVVGHDRGARVGYRLALDHPERVLGFGSLTVVPTIDVWPTVDKAFAMSAFHWFLLAQPGDLAERLLAADPDGFIDSALAKMAGGLDRIEPEVLEAYRAAFRDPAVRHAICEDYRAAAFEDTEHDAADVAAGRRLGCPVMVLWSANRRTDGPTPLEIWRNWASEVSGKAISGGHLQPELSSDEVLAELRPFLARVTSSQRPAADQQHTPSAQ